MNAKGQSHSTILDQGNLDCRSIILKDIFSKTAGPISIKVHMQPPVIGEMTLSNGSGHMTQMAAMPKYGKELGKSSLKDNWADCLETWYVPLDDWILTSLFKRWP